VKLTRAVNYDIVKLHPESSFITWWHSGLRPVSTRTSTVLYGGSVFDSA